MGTVVRGTKTGTGTTAFGPSTVAKSSEVNTDFNTIYSEFNGNVDNDNIKAGAGIVDTKLAQVTTASKVHGSSITGLASVPAGAGYVPLANLNGITTSQLSATAGILGTQLETKIDDTGKISGKAFTELADVPSGAGIVPVANLGSGTGSSSNYLRGDGAWTALSVGIAAPTTDAFTETYRTALIGITATKRYMVTFNVWKAAASGAFTLAISFNDAAGTVSYGWLSSVGSNAYTEVNNASSITDINIAGVYNQMSGFLYLFPVPGDTTQMTYVGTVMAGNLSDMQSCQIHGITDLGATTITGMRITSTDTEDVDGTVSIYEML